MLDLMVSAGQSVHMIARSSNSTPPTPENQPPLLHGVVNSLDLQLACVGLKVQEPMDQGT